MKRVVLQSMSHVASCNIVSLEPGKILATKGSGNVAWTQFFQISCFLCNYLLGERCSALSCLAISCDF